MTAETETTQFTCPDCNRWTSRQSDQLGDQDPDGTHRCLHCDADYAAKTSERLLAQVFSLDELDTRADLTRFLLDDVFPGDTLDHLLAAGSP